MKTLTFICPNCNNTTLNKVAEYDLNTPIKQLLADGNIICDIDKEFFQPKRNNHISFCCTKCQEPVKNAYNQIIHTFEELKTILS